MSFHFSGTRIPSTDPRADEQLASQLRSAMTDWLHAQRDTEIGFELHLARMTEALGGNTAPTVGEITATWEAEATSTQNIAESSVRSVIIRDADDTRYVSFLAIKGMFGAVALDGAFGEDFSYHNSSDAQLSEMTEAEWHHRRDTWFRLLPTRRWADAGTVVEATLDPARAASPTLDLDEVRNARGTVMVNAWLKLPKDTRFSEVFAILSDGRRAAGKVLDEHRHLFPDPQAVLDAPGAPALDPATVETLRSAFLAHLHEARPELAV